jgi:hypothetical protein
VLPDTPYLATSVSCIVRYVCYSIHMDPDFINSMSEVALSIIVQLSKPQSKQSTRGLHSLLLTLCRNMEDVAPRNASVAAQTRADELHLGDIRNYHFDHGSRFPGGRKKSELHWEHFIPAVHLKSQLLSLVNPTSDIIKPILSQSRICWITLQENSKLNSLGFKSVRPDPQLAYQQANITLAYPW